jgi:hypothetical protein
MPPVWALTLVLASDTLQVATGVLDVLEGVVTVAVVVVVVGGGGRGVVSDVVVVGGMGAVVNDWSLPRLAPPGLVATIRKW